MRASALAVLLLATPACAQDTLDADKFEALVEGRSLAWAVEGQAPHGIERYYPDRRVTWFRVDAQACMEGRWTVKGPKDDPAICFVYEDDPQQHCFRVWHETGTLLAVDLQGGNLLQSQLGPEHEVEFGCVFLGM
jgi:hypothetical protein